MKTISIYLAIVLVSLTISCNKEELLNPDIPKTEKLDIKTTYIHYQNQKYEIKYFVNDSGENEALSEIPDKLKDLSQNENLALLVREDALYIFDNLKEEDEFLEKELEQEKMAQKTPLMNIGSMSERRDDYQPSILNNSVTEFNSNVVIYQHKNFTGERLIIQDMSQLFNLTSIGFNDKISSFYIYPDFLAYPSSLLNRRVTFYFDKDFSGRSLSYDRYSYSYVYKNGIRYIGHTNLKLLQYSCVIWFCKNYNDEISSIDTKLFI